MHYKRIFLALILCLVNFCSTAQTITQTVRGTLTEQFTNEPISFAIVVLLKEQIAISSSTDSTGAFIFENVPTGRYDLQVSLMGYETYLQKEIQVSGGKEVVLSISLAPKTQQINEVVIKASVNKEQPLNKMATVSARMLSVEEARRYAGGFDDPARLASSFAGVASNISSNGIVIRGNAPKSLQWKMEGVEIPNPNHFADLSAFGGGGITALSSQMLANSDFFTGAFPAEYSNALSGVFDIFMRTGNNQKSEHTFQLGLIGIDASSEGPFKKDGRSSYLFNYRYSTLSLLTPLLPQDAGGTNYQDLSFKVHIPTKRSGTFSIWGIGLIDRSGADAEIDSSKWEYLQDKETQDVKQYMAAAGISHAVNFSRKVLLKTTIAATTNGIYLNTGRINNILSLQPQNKISNKTWNTIIAPSLTMRLNSRHTNKTGITYTNLAYDLQLYETRMSTLQQLVKENGNSSLVAFYSNSNLRLSDKLTANLGITSQLFTLNNNYSVEPRVGLKWQLNSRYSAGAGYGLHSRLDKLNFYFTKDPVTGALINKDIGFTKAHHFVLSYDYSISTNMHLKIEPYYQYLFNVPVVKGTSYSFINLENDWFFNKPLNNSGKGRNLGIDITLEKYLSKGYYFLFTASLFDSKYLAGDGTWRNTRFNRNYLFNILGGREWMLGKMKQNAFGINARCSYQGGDRYTPVDQTASIAAQDVVYYNSQAFTKQFSPALVAHLTISYKINRKNTAHEISLKVINAIMYEEFGGFRYNYKTNTVTEMREALVIPNLSYKIEF